MSTANNNAVAYATRTTLPTGDFRLIFWHNASTGVVSSADFSQVFEIEYGGGNYVQLYSNSGDATPELRSWRNEAGADAQVLASGTYVSSWIRYYLARTGTTWTLYYALAADVAWTTILTWTNANAWSGLALVGSVTSLGSYTMPGASIRSLRIYTAAHSNADMMTDSLSSTPTLGSLWLACFDGSTASLDGSDSSGNSRPMTVGGGSFVTNASDPISSGITAGASTERTRYAFGSFTPAYGATAVTERARASAIAISTALGAAAATERPRSMPSASTPALGLSMPAERPRTSSRDSSTQATATAATERDRVVPKDFAAAISVLATAVTEQLRNAPSSFATALGAGGGTQATRERGGNSTTALGAGQATAPQRFVGAFSTGLGAGQATAPQRQAFGDFSTSGAAIAFAATEFLRARFADSSTAFAASAAVSQDRQWWRDFQGSLGALSASERTEWLRVSPTSFATSMAATGGTTAQRSNDSPQATAFAGSVSTARTSDAFRDFVAALITNVASERTEYLRFAPGSFTSALGAGAATNNVRGMGSASASDLGAAAASTPQRYAPKDFSGAATALVFGSTEFLRYAFGGSSTVSGATAATERQAVRDSAAASAAAATANTQRLREAYGPQLSTFAAFSPAQFAAVFTASSTTALALAATTEAQRLAFSNTGAAAVILASAVTERVRNSPSSFSTMLGSQQPSVRGGVGSGGVTSAFVGPVLSTERTREKAGDFETELGTLMVFERTEWLRVAFKNTTAVVSVSVTEEVILGGLGAGTAGSMPAGTQMPFATTTRRVTALTLNTILVPFEGVVSSKNPRLPNSPFNPKNWKLFPLDPGAQSRLAQAVEQTQDGFLVAFDGVLSQGLSYRLVSLAPEVEVSEALGYEAEFPAVIVRCDALPRDERDDDGSIRDIGNPFLPSDSVQFPPSVGSYELTATGDLANDSGTTSLRKRIYRRVTATIGDFFHLANYGAGVTPRVKKLIRADELERIRAQVTAQIRKEPDVQSVRVEVSASYGTTTVVNVAVTVRSVGSADALRMVVPVTLP
ncbi:hypothetical protein UFOVP650_67 [uncultured Caudovirales phage]|uniref:Uncharacterized protein n=1 Tax=uncultured Caudovirales phage TaxID=2100421 RepID=A0A6J5NAE6_9CAUD|nr:hypothetical protein UFOVP650_67 [uncultured Caudovirales phage]